MGFLKPKAPKSSNKNRGLINSIYTPQAQTGVSGFNVLAGLLGVPGGDTEGAQAGFQAYKDQAGYAPAMRDLSRSITGQGAASGLLRSGATAQRLMTRGAELNQGFFNNYLQNLAGLAGLGNQAGSNIAGVGGSSTGGNMSTAGGIGETVGGLASVAKKIGLGSIFSDRRMKQDIVKIDEFEDGLGLYRFRYLGSDIEHTGVMADEVAELRPWALGPKFAGLQTVNYGAL